MACTCSQPSAIHGCRPSFRLGLVTHVIRLLNLPTGLRGSAWGHLLRPSLAGLLTRASIYPYQQRLPRRTGAVLSTAADKRPQQPWKAQVVK